MGVGGETVGQAVDAGRMLTDDLFPGWRRPVRYRGRRLAGLVHYLPLLQHARNNAQTGPDGSRVTARDHKLAPGERQACNGRKAATAGAKDRLAYLEAYVAEDAPLLAPQTSPAAI